MQTRRWIRRVTAAAAALSFLLGLLATAPPRAEAWEIAAVAASKTTIGKKDGVRTPKKHATTGKRPGA